MKSTPFRGIAVAVAACLSIALAACQGGVSRPPLTGRVAWPKDGDLWTIDMSTKQSTKITDLPRGAAVTGATWSPDGQQLVFAQFGRRPGENASGSDLYQANADGSGATPFAQRDAPSSVLEAPEWLPSGTVYYTFRRVQAGRESLSIMRKKPGGEPETVVDGGYNPAVSADESVLVYTKNTQNGQAYVRRTLATGAECELLPDTAFQLLALPRLSPDGKRLAFAGSGPADKIAGGCGATASISTHGEAVPALLSIGQWLGVIPEVAWAHGLPWDLWAMNLDGSGVTKLATLQEDEPNVAWSPDGGTHIAVFGTAALYVVDSKGGQAQKVVEGGGYGGLDWTK